MPADSDHSPAPKLRSSLGTFDLILMNVATIVGLRWLSVAAEVGPSSLTLWVIAGLVFFVPAALTVQELSSRMPHEGGLYLWIREACGDTHGFIAGWAYTVSNLVFFPSLLLFISVIVLHVGGNAWTPLAENPWYSAGFCLTLLWAATLLNLFGLSRAKWLQNLGGFSTLLIATLVLGGGLYVWWQHGSATSITVASLKPDLSTLPAFSTFAILILGYQGLELGPILGDEIRDTARTIWRATLIAGLVVAGIYIAGTAALLVALPHDAISAISGIPEALNALGERVGIRHLGVLAAVLMALSSTGGLSAWVGGTARLPFVLGLNRYLPQRLGLIHPKYGSPYVSLLTQAVLTSAVLLLAVAGSAVREAYLLLIDMTVAITCLVWIYIFASLALLRKKAAGRNDGVSLIRGGPLVCGLVALTGIGAMLFAAVVSLIPPVGSTNPVLFVVKGVGGCALVFISGLMIVRRSASQSALPLPIEKT